MFVSKNIFVITIFISLFAKKMVKKYNFYKYSKITRINNREDVRIKKTERVNLMPWVYVADILINVLVN